MSDLENSMRTGGTITVDSLVCSYLRYKDWMDYDTEHSAYCAKEISVMQALFGTSYVQIPSNLMCATLDELHEYFENRQVTLERLNHAAHGNSNESEIDSLISSLRRTGFRSEIHYFTTLVDAILLAVDGARHCQDDEQDLKLGSEFFEDHFDTTIEASFDTIREFIVAEYPKTEFMSFPIEKLYELGLPRSIPADPFKGIN